MDAGDGGIQPSSYHDRIGDDCGGGLVLLVALPKKALMEEVMLPGGSPLGYLYFIPHFLIIITKMKVGPTGPAASTEYLLRGRGRVSTWLARPPASPPQSNVSVKHFAEPPAFMNSSNRTVCGSYPFPLRSRIVSEQPSGTTMCLPTQTALQANRSASDSGDQAASRVDAILDDGLRVRIESREVIQSFSATKRAKTGIQMIEA